MALQPTGGYRGEEASHPTQANKAKELPFQVGLEATGTERSLKSFKITNTKSFYGELPYSLNFYTLFNEAFSKPAIDWWQENIVKALHCSGACTISVDELKEFFVDDRNEHPIQAQQILQHLAKRKVLISKDEFDKLCSPDTSSLFMRGIRWALSSTPPPPTEYVYLPNIEKTCKEITSWIEENQGPTDRVMTLEEFQTLFSNVPEAALKYLQKKLHRCYLWNDGEKACITLLEANSPKTFSELDPALLKLKTARNVYEKQINVYEEKCSKLERLALEAKKANRDPKAKEHLKLKKATEQQIGNLQKQLQNIDTQIGALEDLELRPQILATLKSGLSTQKALHQEMSPEKAEEILLDVQEAMDDSRDIAEALGQLSRDDIAELEDELANLTLEETQPEKPRQEPQKLPSTNREKKQTKTPLKEE